MKKLLSYFLCAAALAGCASFQSKPISAATNAATLERRSLENPRLQKFMEQSLNRPIRPWPVSRWDFALLTLAAFYYSSDLDLSRAREQVAEAGKITAGERPNPKISLLPGVISNPTRSPWIFSIYPSVPIETAGKRGFRLAEAGQLAKAAYLDTRRTAWRVRSRLRSSLLELYFNRKTEEVLKRQVRTQANLVQMLSVLLSKGEIPRPVLTRAQISLDSDRLKLIDIRSRAADSRARLAASLGLSPGRLRPVNISFDFLKSFPEEIALSRLRRRALLSRPDILAALARYGAAQSALQLEIAKQYPDVNLGPGYSFQDSENYWTLGLTLTLPVLNQNQGPIARARALRKQAGAAFTVLQARVMEELDRSEAGYKEMLLKVGTAGALESASRLQMDSARRSFAEGETSRLELLSARELYYADLLLRLQAARQAQQALGRLEDALQSPLLASECGPIKNRPYPEKEKSIE